MIDFNRHLAIENYLSGKLSKKEREAFEQKLAADQALQKELQLQKSAILLVEQAAKFDIKNKLNEIHQASKTAQEQEKVEQQAKQNKTKRILALAGGILLTTVISAALYQYFQVTETPVKETVNAIKEISNTEVPASHTKESSDKSQHHDGDSKEEYNKVNDNRHPDEHNEHDEPMPAHLNDQSNPINKEQEKLVPKEHGVPSQDSVDINHSAKEHKAVESLNQNLSIENSRSSAQASSSATQDSSLTETSSTNNHAGDRSPELASDHTMQPESQPNATASLPCEKVTQTTPNYRIERPCFGDHDGVFSLLSNPHVNFTHYSLDGGKELVDQWKKHALTPGNYTLVAQDEQGCFSDPIALTVRYKNCDYRVQPALYRYLELSMPDDYPVLTFEVRTSRTNQVVYRERLEHLNSFIYKGIDDTGADLPAGNYVFTFSSANKPLVSRGEITIIK
jgi:hypothetical protein